MEMAIKLTNSSTDTPLQGLLGQRSLYINRDNASQGIYRLEVDIDTYPCLNDGRRNLGGLGATLGVDP